MFIIKYPAQKAQIYVATYNTYSYTPHNHGINSIDL